MSSLRRSAAWSLMPSAISLRHSVQKDDISREALKELLFDEIMSFKSID